MLQVFLEMGFEESLREEFGELEFVFAVSEDEQAREMKDADVFMGSPSREVFLAGRPFEMAALVQARA